MQKTFPQTGEGFYFVLNIQTRLAVVDIDAFTHVAGGKHTATARVKAVNTARTVAVEVDNHPAGAVVAVVIPTAFGIATVAAAFNHRATVAVVHTVVAVTLAAIRLLEAAFQAFTRRRRRRRRIVTAFRLLVINVNREASLCSRAKQKRCSQDCKKGTFHSFSLLQKI
jgi:hypothetical protein